MYAVFFAVMYTCFFNLQGLCLKVYVRQNTYISIDRYEYVDIYIYTNIYLCIYVYMDTPYMNNVVVSLSIACTRGSPGKANILVGVVGE